MLLFGVFPGQTPVGGGCALAVFPVLPIPIALPLQGAGPGQGGVSLSYTIPASVIPGTRATVQAFCADPGAPLGFTASNGVEVVIQ